MSDDKKTTSFFSKKALTPTAYIVVVLMAVWSGTTMIKGFQQQYNPNAPITMAEVQEASSVEPVAGDEAIPQMPSVTEDDLKSAPVVDELAASDSAEIAPLKISPDKPEIIKLDRDVVNILVGNEDTLKAIPDSKRTVILIPKAAGATYFKAIDADGKIIMQRHVIVGTSDNSNKYLRIRRACASGDTACKPYSVYYCPDMCHEVSMERGKSSGGYGELPGGSDEPMTIEPTQKQ